MNNMQAELLIRERDDLPGGFMEIVIWRVPRPVRGSAHDYKYRLALVIGEVCVLRYDNEAGKGDHRHIGSREEPYLFSDLAGLIADFQDDVERWCDENAQDQD